MKKTNCHYDSRHAYTYSVKAGIICYQNNEFGSRPKKNQQYCTALESKMIDKKANRQKAPIILTGLVPTRNHWKTFENQGNAS